MVDLALKTLLHDRTRFAITVAGVAFAVLLVLFQVGLFLGLLDNASVTIEHIDADLWVTSKNTPNVDFSHAFPESRVERVRSIPGIERADNLILSFLNIDLPSGAQEGIMGLSRGILFDLHHHRGDQVKCLVHVRKVFQHLHHAVVIFEPVHPRPGEFILA